MDPTITLDASNLDEELAQHTGTLSRVGTLCAEATEELMIAELNLKRTESRLFLHFKNEGESRGVKVSDKTAEHRVRESQNYYDARMEVIQATAKRDKLRADLAALDAKGRHIDLLGRRATEEFKSYRFSKAT